MYIERVYRLQMEFCEISQLLARKQEIELRVQLTQRRMEIVAEASELVYEIDSDVAIRRVPARSAPLLETSVVSPE